MIDLRSELGSAAAAVRQAHLDRLRSLGVSIGWIADAALEHGVHLFGVSRAEPMGRGYYQPSEGEPHLILPVVEDGALVDLVAFRSEAPERWMLRASIGWALGLEKGLNRWLWYQPQKVLPNGEVRHQVGRPVHLFADPLDWLQGGGEGLCVLDWDAPEVRSLDVLPEVVCSTPALAALFARALMRPTRLPKISTTEARNAA